MSSFSRTAIFEPTCAYCTVDSYASLSVCLSVSLSVCHWIIIHISKSNRNTLLEKSCQQKIKASLLGQVGLIANVKLHFSVYLQNFGPFRWETASVREDDVTNLTAFMVWYPKTRGEGQWCANPDLDSNLGLIFLFGSSQYEPLTGTHCTPMGSK